MAQTDLSRPIYPFQDQFVLIAGGTNDLGQVVTARFVELGANVVATYLSEAERQAFVSKYPELANQVYFDFVDAADLTRVEKCVNHHVQSRGVPTALVNLVAGYAYGIPSFPVITMNSRKCWISISIPASISAGPYCPT